MGDYTTHVTLGIMINKDLYQPTNINNPKNPGMS